MLLRIPRFLRRAIRSVLTGVPENPPMEINPELSIPLQMRSRSHSEM